MNELALLTSASKKRTRCVRRRHRPCRFDKLSVGWLGALDALLPRKSRRPSGALTRVRVHCIPVRHMPPRAHNLVSYTLALLVFAVVFGVRAASHTAALAPVALLAALMWCAHFARRAGESAWVHRYGKARVPTSDVVTEYVYYWGFAAWNAVSLTSPRYAAPATWLVVLGSAVFVLAELGNARAHRMLRDLRPEGTKTRAIPRGFLFERVSSPHYLCEILSWVGFALLTQTWAARAFLLVGAGILGSWAHARHVAYAKDFDGQDGREKYPASRRALIPGVF